MDMIDPQAASRLREHSLTAKAAVMLVETELLGERWDTAEISDIDMLLYSLTALLSIVILAHGMHPADLGDQANPEGTAVMQNMLGCRNEAVICCDAKKHAAARAAVVMTAAAVRALSPDPVKSWEAIIIPLGLAPLF